MGIITPPKTGLKYQDSRSKVEQIVGHLIDGISSGNYTPGQRLVEADLTAELSISRGPLREAMRIMETKDLLEMIPNRGARIKNLKSEDIKQRIGLLKALGGLAIQNSDHSKVSYLIHHISQENSVEQSHNILSKAIDFYVKIARLNQDNLLAEYIYKLNLSYFSHYIMNQFSLNAHSLEEQFELVKKRLLMGMRVRLKMNIRNGVLKSRPLPKG